MTHFRLSRLNFVNDTKPRAFPLEVLLKEMRSGSTTVAGAIDGSPHRSLAEVTEYARKLLADGKTDAYDLIKKDMPQLMPAGVFDTRSDIKSLSGLVCLEFDGDVDTAYAFMNGAECPHVVAMWRSLSGKPKMLVSVASTSVDGEALDATTFPHAWYTAQCLFEDVGEPDKSAMRVWQLQALCYDPDLFFNPSETVPLDWSVDDDALREFSPSAEAERLLFDALPAEYVDAIATMQWKANGWSRESVPCPWGEHEFDGWGSRRNATGIHKNGENDYTFHCLKCPPGKQKKRYAPPETHSSPRYSVNTEHQHDTSDMDTERQENKNVVVKWLQETKNKKGKHLLILGSAAGTGKTTVGIYTADRLLYIAQTSEEADNVFQELYTAEEDVIRHRPRMFNRGHKDWDNQPDWETLPLGLGEEDRPCIHPETCNLLAERGHAPKMFCAMKCVAYEKCVESGFLSQAHKEKSTSKVIYAWGEDIAVDSKLAKYIKRICSTDDILIVDEVNPLALSQRRKLDRETLFDLTERFRQPTADTINEYQTLKVLLDHQSTAETPEAFIVGVRDWINGIDDIEAFDQKCEGYPVGVIFSKASPTATHNETLEALISYQNNEVTVPVVDHQTADDTPAFYMPPDIPIALNEYHAHFVAYNFLLKVGLATLDDPPQKHRKLFTELNQFVDENTDIETAPFAFDPKKQTFEFHLKPTLNHKRAIFNTASDPDNLIGEAYRETDIKITRHTGTPPAWKTDLVFQISTGNYLPRHSLIRQEGKGKDKILHLEDRAQEFVDAYILPSIDTGLKVLVVAPKAFQKVESVVGDGGWAETEIDGVIERRTAMLINHHHAEGRNDYQDFDIVFVFHYEPNHNEIPLQAKQIYRNPDPLLDFTREKKTVTLGGVGFDKVVYKDERVQAVYNRECRARLMQSGMRLRPNIHEGKIIVFLSAEPIDIPVTPIAFTPADAKHFTGNWEHFRDTLQQIETAKENGDVQAYTEATGQSESTARRKTKASRNQQNAERNAEIIRLHQQGKSLRETHKHIEAAGYKVSYGTVNNVVKVYKNGQPAII